MKPLKRKDVMEAYIHKRHRELVCPSSDYWCICISSKTLFASKVVNAIVLKSTFSSLTCSLIFSRMFVGSLWTRVEVLSPTCIYIYYLLY